MENRTRLKEGKDIYFGVVRTHLRIKRRWLIPDSDSVILQLRSVISWLRACTFHNRRGGVGIGICISALIHTTHPCS